MAEVDHQQGHGGGDHGGNGGDAEDLGVDVLHDLAGLGPDGGRVGRTGEQGRQAGGSEPGVQPAARVRPPVGGVGGRGGVLAQMNSSFAFWAKTKASARFWVLALSAAGHEKRRPPTSVLRPFSLLLTVLSMTILTYMHLRFKGKTVPIPCQSCAI